MAQQAKPFVTKSDDLGSISGTHMVDRKDQSPTAVLRLYICTTACAHTTKNVKKLHFSITEMLQEYTKTTFKQHF